MVAKVNTRSSLESVLVQGGPSAGASPKPAARQRATTAGARAELARDNALAARAREAAAQAPANRAGRVGGVPMGPWSLTGSPVHAAAERTKAASHPNPRPAGEGEAASRSARPGTSSRLAFDQPERAGLSGETGADGRPNAQPEAGVSRHGLQALLRRPSWDIAPPKSLRREGSNDAEFVQALNEMLRPHRSAPFYGPTPEPRAANEMGWVRLSSGEVLEVPLYYTQVRGRELIVNSYRFPTPIPLSSIEAIQVGELAPAGSPTFEAAAKLRRAIFEQPEAAARLISDQQTARNLFVGRVRLADFGQLIRRDARELPAETGWLYLSELPKAACDRLVRALFRQFPGLYRQLPEEFQLEPSLFRASLEEGVPAEGHMQRLEKMLERSSADAGARVPGPSTGLQGPLDFEKLKTLMRMEVVRRAPSEIHQIPIEERTLALWKTAAAADPAILEQAPLEVRDDREVVKRALRLDGSALAYASERLRADPEVVGWAMDRDPSAYHYALPPLQLPKDEHARSSIREDLDRGRASEAEAAAAELVGPPGTARRELYLRFVREAWLPVDDGVLLIDRDVVLAAASNPRNDDQIRSYWYKLYDRLSADPSFVDDLAASAPGWAFALRNLIRPATAERLARERLVTTVFHHVRRDSPSPRNLLLQPNIDPRWRVPPERWAALASANPAPFVHAFSSHDLRGEERQALASAFLAALREDHSLFSELPSTFRRDIAFLASAIRAAPRLLSTLRDGQRAEIAARFGSDLAYAEDFERRLGELNLRELRRFDGHDRLLYRVVADRTSPAHDTRPVVVVAMAREDHNGAFTGITRNLAGLGEQFRLALYEASSVEELGASIAEATRRQPAEVVIIGGHGTQSSLRLGSKSEVDGLLEVGALTRLRSFGLQGAVAHGGEVSLVSCSSGVGEEMVKNTTNMVADLWPQASVSGLTGNYGGVLEFDGQGRFQQYQASDYQLSKYGRKMPAYRVPARIEST